MAAAQQRFGFLSRDRKPKISASMSSESMASASIASASTASTSSFISPKNNDGFRQIKSKTKTNCAESISNKVDSSISTFFYHIGTFVSRYPKRTIILTLLVAAGCSAGLVKLQTESRPLKLWVPQNTLAQYEEEKFLTFFPPTSRIQHVIVSGNGSADDNNVLTKDNLIAIMKLHQKIQNDVSTYNGVDYTYPDLCTFAGGFCANFFDPNPICSCLVISILKVWSYDLATLEEDDDYMATLNTYGSNKKDYEGVLGEPAFDSDGALVGAQAMTLSYFLKDQSYVENGWVKDPINQEWERSVFLPNVQTAQEENDGTSSNFAYFSAGSFDDEFGGEITGDLAYVSMAYVIAYLFVGATLGDRLGCKKGSRWAMASAVMILVTLGTIGGFGLAALTGLLYSPVHNVLPFVLLGIGVDDSFVIANAFDRERQGVARASEDDERIVKRGSRALSRAGATISVTSLTDLVAFAISSSSSIPALASFCAYASYCIFFLWVFSATFFVSCMVIDEKRQRDNRMDCLFCLKRKEDELEEDIGSKEGLISRYFRNYHAPTILSKPGKVVTLICFSLLFAFGVYGTIQLPVEDTTRNFIPSGSYLHPFLSAKDKYFPSAGGELYITFVNGEEIYKNRENLANLEERIHNLSDKPPYIADSNYQNLMAGFKAYLATGATGVQLGDDGWPVTYEAFVATLKKFANHMGPGAQYAQDVSLSDDGEKVEAFRVKADYVRLTKTYRGEVLDDASLQIAAMDATRDMIDSWKDLPAAFPYCGAYIATESFKLISTELYRNIGLAIAVVGIIVLVMVSNFVTGMLITLNVAFCIIEILGAMFGLGLVIDSVTVINVVLAVGLSVDYSAHIGHCFMIKGGDNKDARATESLADIGASVLNGALSTFLAVCVLLFSKSYVFKTLAIQFALTVALGLLHGLILLPVLLSLLGPKPFASAEPIKYVSEKEKSLENDESMKKDEHSQVNTQDSASTDESTVVVAEAGEEDEVLVDNDDDGDDTFEENAAVGKVHEACHYSIQVNAKLEIIDENELVLKEKVTSSGEKVVFKAIDDRKPIATFGNEELRISKTNSFISHCWIKPCGLELMHDHDEKQI